MSFTANAHAGDLLWWRESEDLHTVITIWGGTQTLSLFGPDPPAEVEILLRLHYPSGALHSFWTQTLRPGRPFIVDSQAIASAPREGVLAILPPAGIREDFQRFYSMVDWFDSRRGMVSLHSDHSLAPRTAPLHFTEIVIRETGNQHNFLVWLNGATPLEEAPVITRIRNAQGDTLEHAGAISMAPFSLCKVALAGLFPDLADFCDGRHVTVEGVFAGCGTFNRPYVITEGTDGGAYHGGNLYQWPRIPRTLYKAFGNGEMNPMAAIESDTMSTTVNLLNTHGDLEEDFWVDADLFDENGVCVASRKRWLLARRNRLSRGEIRALLPHSGRFAGHIALRFSDDDRTGYPRRLQALLEYRTSGATAHVMAWSDIWNARGIAATLRKQLSGFFPMDRYYPEKPLPENQRFRCHYRVWSNHAFETLLSISNCGLTREYASSASYTLVLFNAAGETVSSDHNLPPHGTHFRAIGDYFPSASEFLSPGGAGLLSVVSASDLAIVQFTRHRETGACSAEHFLVENQFIDGVNYVCCGS